MTHSRPIPWRRGWFALVALVSSLAGAGHATAQVSVQLVMPQTEAVINEAVPFEVVVVNGQPASAPRTPEIAGCVVRFEGGPSSHTEMQVIGGQRTVRSSVRYHYSLIAREAGIVTIPPIEVVVDGTTYRTNPQKLSILKRTSGTLALAELRCNADKLYVGQRARFVLTVYVKPFRTPRGALSRDWMANCIRSPQRRSDPFTFVRAAETRRAVDDGPEELFYTYEWEAVVRVDAPGQPLTSTVDVIIDYPTSIGRNFFGELELERTRRLYVPVEAHVPEVLPLPLDGRPQGFAGAVGVVRIETMAKPTQVRLGEPIELTIVITGDDGVDSLPAPDLSGNAALCERFRVPDESLAGRMVGDRRLFTQTIRPRSIDVREIPPIELPYFDPDRGAYAVARSKPIPISVSDVPRMSEVDIVGIAPPDDRIAAATPQSVDGLRGNILDERALLARTPLVSMRDVVAVIAAPPALFVLTWGWTTLVSVRRRNAAAHRRRTALATALRRLDAARALPPVDRCREIASAVAGYFSDRFDAPPARVLGRTAVEYLRERGAAAAAFESLAALLDACDRLAYSGGGSDDAELVDTAHTCLTMLERQPL